MFLKKIHKLGLLKTSIYLNKNYCLIRGNFGIKSLSLGLIKYKHLENVRRKISKQFKRLEKKRFKIFVRISIWHSYTQKPMLSRMGKGAGVIVRWVTFVKAGLILIEILSYKPFSVVQSIIKRATFNFPLKTVLVYK